MKIYSIASVLLIGAACVNAATEVAPEQDKPMRCFRFSASQTIASSDKDTEVYTWMSTGERRGITNQMTFSYGNGWLEASGGANSSHWVEREDYKNLDYEGIDGWWKVDTLYDITEPLSPGGNTWRVTEVDTDSSGGNSTLRQTNWLASRSIWDEHCDVADPYMASESGLISADEWEDYTINQTYTRSAETRWHLQTGGKALPRRSNLFAISGSADEVLDLRAHWPWGINSPDNTSPIDPTEVMILDKFLGPDGILYKVLPDDTELDVTPEVDLVDFYTFGVGAGKHILVHQTVCTALTATNNDRTTIGVGEDVNILFDPPVMMTFPEHPIWITSDGTLDGTAQPVFDSGVLYTAPDHHAGAMVRVFVRDVQLDTFFSVLEPTGHGYAEITETNHYPVDTIGAGMQLIVTWYPTEVSLNHVSLMELNCDASKITGFCTNFPVAGHTTGNNWFALNCDNASTDLVESKISGPPTGLYPGGWDLDIPVYWQITGSSSSNYLTHLIHSARLLNSSGDFSVSKLGKTITRSVNDVSY